MGPRFPSVRYLAPLLAVALCAAADPAPPVVYLPYADTPKIDPHGQQVFLAYDEFRRLWEASRPSASRAGQPPVGAAITSCSLKGALRGPVAQFRIELDIAALGEGWSAVALPADLPLASIAASDPRIALERGEQGLRLHLPGPGAWSVTGEAAVAVATDAAGRRRLALALPAAGAARLELAVPEGVEAVECDPALAAAVLPSGSETLLRVVCGGAPRLAMSWKPRLAAEAGEPLLLSEARLEVVAAERAVRLDARLAVDCLRVPARELALGAPADAQVLALEGPEVDGWDRDGERLRVRLRQPLVGRGELHLVLERALPAAAPGETRSVPVPWVRLERASRFAGVAVLRAEEGLAAQLAVPEGLMQADPAAVEAAGAVAAWRFAAPPATASVSVIRLLPELRGRLLQLVRLGAEETHVDLDAQLEVRRAGLFAVRLHVPAAWELVEHGGLAVDEARPGPAVGGWRELTLDLRARLVGDGRLHLRFRAPASLPREPAAIAALPVGIVRLEGARQNRGVLAVAAPRSWALSSATRAALLPTDPEGLRRGELSAAVRRLAADEGLALGFTWLGGAEEPGLVLACAPRERELALTAHELVTVAEGSLRRQWWWRGEVRYRPVSDLTLVLPAGLGERLAIKGPPHEKGKVSEDAAAGTATWTLRFATPLIGPLALSAEAVLPLPALAAGRPATVAVPAVRLEGAARATALTAVARDGALEVAVEASADRLAVADLPPELQGAGVVAGFSAAAPPALRLSVVRHDLIALADAAVTHARCDAVVGEDRVARVRLRALVASRGRPHLEIALPAGAELLAAAVDGKVVRPSRRDGGALLLPLGDRSGDHRLALAYELRLGDGRLPGIGRIALAMPVLGGAAGGTPVPVQRLGLALHLPRELRPLAVDGDLSPAGRMDQLNAGDDGLGLDFPDYGGLVLERLGDGGSVAVLYAANGWLQAAAVALALAGIALGWWLRRRGGWLAALVLVALIGVLAASGAWMLPAAGGALGCLTGLIAALVARWRAARAAARVAAAQDAWMA